MNPSLLILALASPLAADAPATQVAPVDPRVEKLLRDIESRGRTIRTIQTRIKRTKHLRLWRRKKVSEGRLVFQRPDLFNIEFDKPRRERFVCDGTSFYEVYQRTKQVIKHTIPKEKRGTFLDRPPLKFLIGQPADEALRLYAIQILAEDAATVQVELRPLPTNTHCDFTKARITFAKTDLIPVRIHRWLRQEKRTEEIHEFADTKINGTVSPGAFRPPAHLPGWSWDENPVGKPKRRSP